MEWDVECMAKYDYNTWLFTETVTVHQYIIYYSNLCHTYNQISPEKQFFFCLINID